MSSPNGLWLLDFSAFKLSSNSASKLHFPAPKCGAPRSPSPQISVLVVKFLGHDTHPACKYWASGYVLSFLLFISLLSLYFSCISFTWTQFMPHMDCQFGRYACMHRTAQRRLNHSSAQTFPLYPNYFIFLSLGSFSGSTEFPLLFLLFLRSLRAERVRLYIRLLFLLSRLHEFTIQVRRQVNHTLPSSIVRISLLLQ